MNTAVTEAFNRPDRFPGFAALAAARRLKSDRDKSFSINPIIEKTIMHPNAELITKFYTSFGNRDANGMAACYHADVRFSDEVFPDLRGTKASAMWQMLCERGKDLKIEFRDIEADDITGRTHWDAWYTFSATGRPVHNKIEARFEFLDGKIIRHRDTFDFWAWASQALGTKGRLLGWSSMVKNRVRLQAGEKLEAFIRERDSRAAK